MSAAQRERTENALNNFFTCWRENGLPASLRFHDMEKQRDACLDLLKTDQGQCLKLYSIWVEHFRRMVAAGRSGSAGEICKAGNESWTETAALTDKYCHERSAALQRLWQSFVPGKGNGEAGS